jgi:predicted TIM-barrel fold metal-dependent hydrolase
MLDDQLRNGSFGAMAEVLVWHAAKTAADGAVQMKQVKIGLDDPRVRMALDAAVQRHWPFIVHVEFATAQDRESLMGKFESLLSTYPTEPFVLIHLGQLDASSVRALIEKHANIYFMTSTANPITARRGNQPWTNMFAGRQIAPVWKVLLVEHPDRFVLGFDNVVAENWGPSYLNQISLWRTALMQLPEGVSLAIAHRNAERLWHLD